MVSVCFQVMCEYDFERMEDRQGLIIEHARKEAKRNECK